MKTRIVSGDDRAILQAIASRIACNPADSQEVLAHTRALRAWVEEAALLFPADQVEDDVEARMTALTRHNSNRIAADVQNDGDTLGFIEHAARLYADLVE